MPKLSEMFLVNFLCWEKVGDLGRALLFNESGFGLYFQFFLGYSVLRNVWELSLGGVANLRDHRRKEGRECLKCHVIAHVDSHFQPHLVRLESCIDICHLGLLTAHYQLENVAPSSNTG